MSEARFADGERNGPVDHFEQRTPVTQVKGLQLALRFARRELRGGLAGFRVFFFCLVLGSASIAGVQSLSDAFMNGLQDQGQILLGGDVSVRQIHRPLADKERAFLESRGRVSQTMTMRAMS